MIEAALSAGTAGGVGLAGGPGVGKTRLAREAVLRAAETERDTDWVVATRSAAAVPFGALWHLLAEASRSGASPLELLRQTAARLDGHRLDRAAAAFDDLGLPVHAAELAGAAARAHRAHGRAAAEALSLQQVSTLGPDLADARTPLLKINWAERRQGLTRREREIALMAASGLSSRTIAAKLQLSVRTVSNHLAHVYAKLGVASRAELAALLTRAAAHRPA